MAVASPLTETRSVSLTSWWRARGRAVVAVALLVTGCASAAALMLFTRESREGDLPTSRIHMPADRNAPRLVFDQTEIRLGEIPIQEYARTVEFPFINKGTADLHLRELTLGCSCAGAKVTSSVIPPGARGTVLVSIHPQQSEERGVAVIVHSDDPVQSETSLSLQWRAVFPVELEVLSVDLGNVRPGQVVERSLAVRRAPHVPRVEISKVDVGPAGAVTASYFGPSGGGSRPGMEEIRLSLVAPPQLGPGNASLRVHLEKGWKDNFVVPVRWTVQDPLIVAPRQVFCGYRGPGTCYETTIVIHADEGEELRIDETRVEPPSDDVHLDLVQPDVRQCQLPLKVRFPVQEGPFRFEIHVRMSSPEPREVVIPCSGIAGSQLPKT